MQLLILCAPVWFVRPGVVQVFTLQINLRAAKQLRPTPGVIDRTRSADVVPQFVVEFGEELRIALRAGVGFLQFVECADQGFSDKDTPVLAEMARSVRQIVNINGHQQSPCSGLQNLHSIKRPVPSPSARLQRHGSLRHP
ncbi:MAG: hypothetical protein AW10_02319 [Candidatus Accumulibacter appositus]|uniref:Uncharacterized protein n=1 Tax=Candidatus Accumulibacter appositus TaxID=1454003 RepID=A0A011NVX4_9PROT|nr:MAG: hypothetical protein AW10_02319 [Candidatus Accumulibacter appositus]